MQLKTNKSLLFALLSALVLLVSFVVIDFKMPIHQDDKTYKALIIAYADFAQVRKFNQPTHNPLQVYAQDIRNYEIALSRNGENIKVRFNLVRKFNQEILGGDAEYVINPTDFKIESRKISM